MRGWRARRSTAARASATSCSRMAAAPTWSFSAKATPARMSPRMSGVPPSSRSASLLDVVDLVVAAAGDVVHGAAARALGRAGAEEVAVGHQHARALRPSQELVGRDEDGVEPLRRVGGVHVDGDVGAAGGVVDEGERALLVEHAGHRAHVGEEPVDVGGGREGSGHERAPARGAGAAPQVGEVDAARGRRGPPPPRRRRSPSRAARWSGARRGRPGPPAAARAGRARRGGTPARAARGCAARAAPPACSPRRWRRCR